MMLSQIPSSLVQQLGWVLIHSCWQFALVAWFAWLGGMVCRRHSAATRYGLYLMALTAIIVAPVITGWQFATAPAPITAVVVPAWSIASNVERSEQPADAVISSPPNESLSSVPATALPSDVSSTASSTVTIFSVTMNWGPGWPAVANRFAPWLPMLVNVWCVGMLAFACRPLFGWYVVRRLRNVGVSAASSSLQSLVAETARKLGVRQVVSIWYSSLVHAPVVMGYFKPAILLPLSIVTELNAAQLEAIIAHELAHVRRHDYVVNLLQTLIETIFFYHPAVWWLSHQIRVEREHCCDDIAVAALGNRREYGRALLAVEELRGTSMALVLGAGGGPLLARVRRLLSAEVNQQQSSVPGVIVLAMLLVTGILLGVGLNHDNRANAQTPAPKADAVSQEPPAAQNTELPQSGNGKLLIVRPPELPADLQRKFSEWDKEYRHKSEEKFLELEALATKLAEQTKDPAQQASIYAQVAHIAGQSIITKHVDRVRKFATKALATSHDLLQRVYMYSLMGSTYEVDERVKEFPERRQLAAERFLTGWVELLSYDVPDRAPELPGVGGGRIDSNDPAELEKARKINEAQVVARKQAEYVRDVVNHRDMLANQLRWLFRPDSKVHGRGPDGPDELRRLSAKLIAEVESERLLKWVTAVNPLHPEQAKIVLTAPGSVLDQHVSMYVRGTPLQEMLATLVTSAGGELQLDGEGLKEVGLTKNVSITFRMEDVPLREALTVALSKYPQISFTHVGKIVFVSSKDRVKNRETAAQSAKDAVLKQFAGDWRVYGEGIAHQIDKQAPASKIDVRYRVTGAEVLRMKNWEPYGCGTLDVDTTTSPPTFVMQFKDPGGDAGYLRGSYQFSPDGSLWLTVIGPYQQRGTFVEATGNEPWTIYLKREKETPDPAARKAATLEFRYAANPAESNVEPRVPADYLQRHYRDGSQTGSEPSKDRGFAWFPIAETNASQIDLPLEGTIGKQRRGLLSDLPEHNLLADGSWTVLKCDVVPDESGKSDRFSIQLRLDEGGGKKFTKLTTTYLNQKLAIVVNGQIVAAPIVRNAIGADVMITGNFSRETAENLAKELRK